MSGRTVLRLCGAAVCAATLASCGGDSRSSWYQSPAGLTPQAGATVSMSTNSPLGGAPDGDTRVVTIDGLPVFALDFDKVVLPPGAHTLGVEFNGAFAYGTIPVNVTFRAGTSYFVKGQRSGPCDAVVWLQDQSTGQPFGDKQATHLITKPASTGTPFSSIACN
jgi:hypothetical protein